MPKVLVVDDMAIFRDPIAASLQLAGYKTCCAANGKEALVQLSNEQPELILLDLAMPEIDGLEFLKVLRRDPGKGRTPVILLTAISEKQIIVQAAKLGAADCIFKSKFSMKDLLERVKKHLPAYAEKTQSAVAPASPPSQPPRVNSNSRTIDQKSGSSLEAAADAAPAAKRASQSDGATRLLTREQCIQRAEQAMSARTLSGVVAQVISLAASPRGDLSQLATLVAKDPMLSARILQAANSVSYASTRGLVSTLQEAVRNIGCAAVRDIAASLGVFDAMPASDADGFNPIRSWQHSFAVATLCHRLAPEKEGGSAYLVGLCHDLGEILFHSHFGNEYRQVVEAQQATGKRRDELERLMLGITHGELVQTILRCLGLPEEIRRPIASFHEAGMTRAASEPLARLLQVADLYATGTLLASSEHSPLRPLTRPECRTAIGRDDPPRPDSVVLRGEIYALTAMLARLSPREEAKVMQPPYPRKSTRVMLVRDPSLSPFDPVAAALESLADMTVRGSLPPPPELGGHAGLVVVARSTSAGGFTADAIRNSAPPPLPVLWLTGRIDGATTATPDPLVPVLWPAPLSRLAEFVQTL